MSSLVAVPLAAVLAAASPSSPAAAEAGARTQVRRTGEVVVALPLERAFPLVTADGERLWAPGWEPVVHWPGDGSPAAGAVFSTAGHDGVATHWVVVDWEPARHRVRYARVTPGLRAGTVEVECRASGPASTIARVTYDLVALSAAGDADLASWSAEWYRDFLAGWERDIAAALARP
jgi:hypothetical protein